MFTLRTPKKAWNLQTWKGSIRKFHTDLGSMPEIKTKKHQAIALDISTSGPLGRSEMTVRSQGALFLPWNVSLQFCGRNNQTALSIFPLARIEGSKKSSNGKCECYLVRTLR
jgi:hypothetical protein